MTDSLQIDDLVGRLFPLIDRAALLLDDRGRITAANHRAEHLLGIRHLELRGRDVHATLHGWSQETSCRLLRILKNHDDAEGDDWFVHRDGSIASMRFSYVPVRLPGIGSCYVLAFTGHGADSNEFADLACLFDAATGLPNAALFFDRVYQSMLRAKRDHAVFSVIVVSVEPNDAQLAGLDGTRVDELLRHVARHIRGIVRESDTLARVGARELGMVMSGEGAESVVPVVNKIASSVPREITIGPRTLELQATVGSASYPRDGRQVDLLLRHADVARHLSRRVDDFSDRAPVT